MSVLKSPFLCADLLDDLDAALAGQQLGVDDVDVLGQVRLQQAGGKGSGQQFGAALGRLAAVADDDLADRPLRHLGVQQAEAPSQIDVRAQLLHLAAINRRHVDGGQDDAAREEVDHELGRLGGDGQLGLSGAGAEVRRQDDIRQLEQRMVGRRRLLHEDVKGGAGEVAGLQRIGECFFVDDAAASAVDDASALLHLGEPIGADEVERIGAAGERGRSGSRSAAGRRRCRATLSMPSWAARSGARNGSKPTIFMSKAGGPAGDLAADASEADDAERFAGELRADELVAFPLAGSDVGVGRGNHGGRGPSSG